MKTLVSVVALFSLAVVDIASQTDLRAVSLWRAQHEREIVNELFQLVSIPNVSSDLQNIRRNVDLLTSLFRSRGFTVETLPTSAAPLVVASLDVVQPKGVLTFYAHYDGQPVEPLDQWTRTSPFSPQLIGPDGVIEPDKWPTQFDPSWRVYGRSAADDKGPIVALLSAIDALRAGGAGPTWSVRVVLDGDEEAASPSFQRVVSSAIPRIRGDLAIILDGPGHPSGRPVLFFGMRGFGARITMTVFGADRNLHSGHYGNWAPDPSIRLARLLASLKDDQGRVLVSGFYDDIVPLTATERRAIADVPNIESLLAQEFHVARPENPAERLETKHNLPTLAVVSMESGGGVRGIFRGAIPSSAAAVLETRVVPQIDPAKQVDRLVVHVRKQGYTVVTDRDPTDAERRGAALLVRIDARLIGSASKTSMDHPMAQALFRAAARVNNVPVRLPTIGGSLPFTFDDFMMPTVGLSLVNYDNNQHAPNENLRLQNLWDAIEVLGSILTMTSRPMKK